MDGKWIYTTTGQDQNQHIRAKHFDIFLQKHNMQRNAGQYIRWIRRNIQQYKSEHGLTDSSALYREHAEGFIAFLENSEPHNE